MDGTALLLPNYYTIVYAPCQGKIPAHRHLSLYKKEIVGYNSRKRLLYLIKLDLPQRRWAAVAE